MQLIAEAKADGVSTDLVWHVNSGDATLVQAATFAAAMFYELGLNVEVRTVDLANLMTVANSDEMQIVGVQYTYAPADPYTDMSWLLSEYGWTRYTDEEVANALFETQALTDIEAIREKYLFVNQKVQEDVPMASMYIISTLGVTSSRLTGATPDVFGTFINVHEWEIGG